MRHHLVIPRLARFLQAWRRLQTSDHFYYMCTKYFADGDVHKYFNPYASPYDSYINFMSVLDNLRSRCAESVCGTPPQHKIRTTPPKWETAGDSERAQLHPDDESLKV